MLVNYCTEEIRRRFGPGRKPTLRQIEKQAYVWSREELFTMDLADRWLKERAGKRRRAEELARLLGIQNRSPAPSEEKYLLAWLDMGFDREALLRAYDKTIYKKGELAWPYMNRILENWHAKGLHTLPEIEAGDRPPRQAKGGGSAPAGPTPEEYERMQRYLNKLNGGGDHGT
jgi:DnaD/phage-associated family protein